jgi:glycosyltransferase involved in cell wall biosynthesis
MARLLLSAYACEPNKGSEPGVGWHWALELARSGHEVSVLTRSNNRATIERALADHAGSPVPRFHYCDLPAWASRWKSGRRGVHLYYLLWQWMAYRHARRLTARQDFDAVHHVTFVSARQPSFMGLLGLPFTFGPVSGGETVPAHLRKGLPLKGQWLEVIRDVANALVKIDPLMHLTFSTADRIVATSAETLSLIPARYHAKTSISLAIGIDEGLVSDRPPDAPPATGVRLLYAGQLLYWKGVHLALQAFARVVADHPEAHLTIVGTGPEYDRLQALATRLGVAHAVRWLSRVEQHALFDLFGQHDVFVFPSLRDSGGMAVLEAMAHGLPVVCLDRGGPGVTVAAESGIAIGTDQLGEDEVVNELARAMTQLLIDTEARERLASGAVERARQYTWDRLVRHVYPPIGT